MANGGQSPPGERPGAQGGEPPESRRMLPVWFFVGVIVLIYGIIILVTGLTEIHHPAHTILAAELHPTIWWGAILVALGTFFLLFFRHPD